MDSQTILFNVLQDFEINFPVHELSMETTNVQEVDGKLLLRSPPNQKFVYVICLSFIRLTKNSLPNQAVQ